MRKLASIQKVTSVQPIEDADRIVKIQVLGWTLVAKKGEFKEGDLCIYFEVDSLMPAIPSFSFLNKSGKEKKNYRLRTSKMRGVVSQGLAMPLSLLDDLKITWDGEVGDDLTDALGIKKYEPNFSNTRVRTLHTFPFYVPKTEAPNIQSNPELLDYHSDTEFIATVKMDGCSATYVLKDGEFMVCSRNFVLGKKRTENIKKAEDRYHYIAEKFDLKNRLGWYGKGSSVAIQGEICGPRIQGNKLELEDLEFYVFDVYDIDLQKYVPYKQMAKFCRDTLGLSVVPYVLQFRLDEKIDMEDLLKLADGKYEGTDNYREGIVCRPVQETYSELLEKRLTFKVKSKQFLLNGGD